MLEITLNGQRRALSEAVSVQHLLRQLGYDSPRGLAVEVNCEVVPAACHAERWLAPGDSVEVVTLVGGGSPTADKPLLVGKFRFQSRLITGTGKYATYDLMRECLLASGCEVTTVAVRRERLIDKQGRNILDYLDLGKLTILPNTAGCFSAEDAIRHARLARAARQPRQRGRRLGQARMPRRSTDAAARSNRDAGSDPAIGQGGFPGAGLHQRRPDHGARLKEAGAASVMPAGSPIGSGQGILNPNNLRIILEYLKAGDPEYPVIVDAGVGTASDVAVAMELGCDGVLLNTGIAHAQDPLRMAYAMKYACEAGRLAFLAGRIPKKLYAQASSPMEGRIAPAGGGKV